MKKRFGVLLLLIFVAGFASAQKSNKYGKSRKDFFGGAEDYRDISKNGLQISFGVNYTLAPKNLSYSGVDANLGNRPYDATVDPSGKPGGFIDVGMAHYRLKPSKVLGAIYKLRKDNKPIKFIGSNLIHRIDWGIGFDYIGGAEKTIVNYPTFNLTNEEKGSFYNGYLYGRITADRFTQLNDKWHLETGLGLNFNYALFGVSQESIKKVEETKMPYSVPSAPLRFQKDFMTQLHGHIGFNYKIRRGDYLIFGFYLPAIGFYEWNKAKPTIQWYSSNYYPLHLQVKWIHHFTKKSNGCNTGSPEDRKRNQEYMQNR